MGLLGHRRGHALGLFLVAAAFLAPTAGALAACPESRDAAQIRSLFGVPPPDEADGCGQEGPIEDIEAWCEALARDFPSQRGVVQVEPLVRAARYDDPAFAPWQNHCPAVPMNAIQDGFIRLAELDGLDVTPPLPGRLVMRRLAFATRDFRLYEVDFDGSPVTPPTVVFFGEGAYDYWQAVRRLDLPAALPTPHLNWNAILPPPTVPADLAVLPGGFVAVDLDRCTVELAERASTRPASAGETGYALASESTIAAHSSGIMSYRGRTGFFTVIRHDTNWAEWWVSLPRHRGARPWPAIVVCHDVGAG